MTLSYLTIMMNLDNSTRKWRDRIPPYNYLQILENSSKNLPKQQYRLWTDDYHPIALKSEKWFRQKMEYMHNNPVRIGFVEQPEYWKYSSARNWLMNDDSIISLDRQVLYEEG